MALVSIDVRTVQQALTEASDTTPIVPSPGAIDGLWGTRTRVSLDVYRGLISHGRSGVTIEQRLSSIPDRAVAILIEDWVALSLRADARAYLTLPTGADVPTPTSTNATVASRVSAMGQETRTTLPFPAAALVAPVGRAPSWLPLLLGLGAAIALVGGGYWLYTRSRGRRRR